MDGPLAKRSSPSVSVWQGLPTRRSYCQLKRPSITLNNIAITQNLNIGMFSTSKWGSNRIDDYENAPFLLEEESAKVKIPKLTVQSFISIAATGTDVLALQFHSWYNWKTDIPPFCLPG